MSVYLEGEYISNFAKIQNQLSKIKDIESEMRKNIAKAALEREGKVLGGEDVKIKLPNMGLDGDITLTIKYGIAKKVDKEVEDDFDELTFEEKEIFRVKKVYEVDARKFKAAKAAGWKTKDDKPIRSVEYITTQPSMPTIEVS